VAVPGSEAGGTAPAIPPAQPWAPQAPVFAAPYPPPFGPPAPPYPAVLPALVLRPRSGKTTAAAVLWVLVILRHAGFLALVTIWWAERPITFSRDFAFSPIDDDWLLLTIVLGGFFGAIGAAVCDLVRAHHEWGTIAGALSLGASVTPGLLFGFGIVGVALSLAALLLHIGARAEFRVSQESAAYAAQVRA
jgi:hypothetical protein